MITFLNPKPWRCKICGRDLDYWINGAKEVTCDDCLHRIFREAMKQLTGGLARSLAEILDKLGVDSQTTPALESDPPQGGLLDGEDNRLR